MKMVCTRHHLIPWNRLFVKVYSSYGEVLLVRCVVISKELLYFKNLLKDISTIKTWKVQLNIPYLKRLGIR